jgi:hypothetical protein
MILMATLLGACSTQASGALAQLQTLAKTCPHGAELEEYAGWDDSASGQQATITTARMAVLKDIATEVAACNGHLHVDAFTGSAAASAVVFDGDLKPAGATEIARLRKVNALVDTTMTSIKSGLTTATKTLSPNGSDITSQFGMASQFYDQLTGHVELHVDLLTDGVQTVGVVLNTKHLTPSTAANLATTATVMPLPDTAVVKISGLGKTAGSAPPTSYTDSLVTFFHTYCKRTGAASCVAVTDYTA